MDCHFFWFPLSMEDDGLPILTWSSRAANCSGFCFLAEQLATQGQLYILLWYNIKDPLSLFYLKKKKKNSYLQIVQLNLDT
jgi:hypothetical protein